MDNALTALSNELAAAVERGSGAIVGIEARMRFPSSGIHWRPGVVVTAAHTVKRDDEISITLADGRKTRGTLVGLDRGTDVAVLRIEGEAATALPTVERASRDPLRPGDLILAVGRSPAHGVGAALGVVSLIGDSWRTWRGGRIDRLIRLDVSLYPGFSGAAVIGAGGGTHGLATNGLSRYSALAIPQETIDRTVDEILTRGYVSRGYLGLGLQSVVIPGGNRGLIILSIEADGPADRAGVLIGDILATIDNRKVAEVDDVHAALEASSPGRGVKVSLLRGGAAKEIEVTVGERPQRRG
jgi:S1-C subfamily serine protease